MMGAEGIADGIKELCKLVACFLMLTGRGERLRPTEPGKENEPSIGWRRTETSKLGIRTPTLLPQTVVMQPSCLTQTGQQSQIMHWSQILNTILVEGTDRLQSTSDIAGLPHPVTVSVASRQRRRMPWTQSCRGAGNKFPGKARRLPGEALRASACDDVGESIKVRVVSRPRRELR
ncbi:hypothetical protein O1Q96_00850 (plasmid) [Streptomyces sp. Qhu-G9]|uniref:hypothetical protein n=1 Tax=Streptomyces sp. Qhu-G9 TaxID=3452799 RepID=UPI0022AC2270|nr:hypothetical protein [Streptomyces aurantiacus]WAU78423.1 hypothetical protein O1Q96_00850 [Streptomyces aurantiacus]